MQSEFGGRRFLAPGAPVPTEYDRQKDIEVEGQRAAIFHGQDAPNISTMAHLKHGFDFDLDAALRAKAEEEAKAMTKHPQKDERRFRLHLIDAILRGSDLPPATQAAVALLASTLAVTRVVEGTHVRRGEVINSACNDFRGMLQKYLPGQTVT